MSYENLDKLNELFDKLTTEKKLQYYEELLGDHLGYLWKDWDDDLVKEEVKRFKEIYGVEE